MVPQSIITVFGGIQVFLNLHRNSCAKISPLFCHSSAIQTWISNLKVGGLNPYWGENFHKVFDTISICPQFFGKIFIKNNFWINRARLKCVPNYLLH